MNVGQWRSIENLSKCEKKRKIGERKKNNFFFFTFKSSLCSALSGSKDQCLERK